ncbi:hypothetical protein CSHISOI_11839 [Colletotrichum shisoi]|uniref:Uncharacterized protein n=1 Tax=Colletotrichum shisoi TaxID=2078593 RepID=A0A5Q4B9D6_9PEZI|nr:hypothetical protein CSHISOI_11839 [Colletotrichum shisoi]
MNFKVALALLFASAAIAVPGHSDSNVLARDPQRDRPTGAPAGSCCSSIPGTCNCSCVSSPKPSVSHQTRQGYIPTFSPAIRSHDQNT